MRDAWLSVERDMSGSLSVGRLVEAKKAALRRCIWFRALSRVERGIIDLTVKCVGTIKSVELAKVVTVILGKLQSAMESVVDRLVRTTGLCLTRKISNIAVSWGNHSASGWADDGVFARFLVVTFVKVG